MFIQVHYRGAPILLNVRLISSVSKYESGTKIYMAGDSDYDYFLTDEPYEWVCDVLLNRHNQEEMYG